LNISWKNILLVFAGGSLGTLLRFGLDISFGSLLGLAAVNIVGSGLIGWFNSDPRISKIGRRLFLAVGFAGGFTTMSGVALLTSTGIAATISGGQPVSLGLFGYVFFIFAASLLAYWGAHALGERLTGNNAPVSHDVEEVTE
jgi:fluoride ion exporter CrcB/FEX